MKKKGWSIFLLYLKIDVCIHSNTWSIINESILSLSDNSFLFDVASILYVRLLIQEFH